MKRKAKTKRERTPEEIRSYNMSRIRSKDTKIEVMLRKELWRRGYRYRKNDKTVFGKPDIVFKKQKIAIFCDSEFWHGYNWAERKKRIKSNTDYWYKKIERNMQRDIEVNEELISKDWTVIRFWDTEINKDIDTCVEKIVKLINLSKV